MALPMKNNPAPGLVSAADGLRRRLFPAPPVPPFNLQAGQGGQGAVRVKPFHPDRVIDSHSSWLIYGGQGGQGEAQQ